MKNGSRLTSAEKHALRICVRALLDQRKHYGGLYWWPSYFGGYTHALQAISKSLTRARKMRRMDLLLGRMEKFSRQLPPS